MRQAKQKKGWRLTDQGRAFLLVILLVLIAAFLLNHSLLFLLAALFVATFIYDALLLRLTFPKLLIQWEPPHQLFAGRQTRLPLFITNPNRLLPLRQLKLQLEGIVVTTQSQAVFDIDPQQTTEIVMWFCPPRRGRLKLTGLEIRCGYPFGFWEFCQVQQLDMAFVVFPALLPQAPEELFGSQQRKGIIPRHGEDFQYLAKYQSGDDVRLIHWRKSTLLEHPVIRKDLRQIDAAKPKILIADPCPQFELGLSALATMAHAATAWGQWSLWTANGLRLLPTRQALLSALATLQPLTQDELAQATMNSQAETIRVSQIATAPSTQAANPANAS